MDYVDALLPGVESWLMQGGLVAMAHTNYSLNCLKRGYLGDHIGGYIGVFRFE